MLNSSSVAASEEVIPLRGMFLLLTQPAEVGVVLSRE